MGAFSAFVIDIEPELAAPAAPATPASVFAEDPVQTALFSDTPEAEGNASAASAPVAPTIIAQPDPQILRAIEVESGPAQSSTGADTGLKSQQAADPVALRGAEAEAPVRARRTRRAPTTEAQVPTPAATLTTQVPAVAETPAPVITAPQASPSQAAPVAPTAAPPSAVAAPAPAAVGQTIISQANIPAGVPVRASMVVGSPTASAPAASAAAVPIPTMSASWSISSPAICSVDAPDWLQQAKLDWRAEKVQIQTNGVRVGDRRDDIPPPEVLPSQHVEGYVAIRRSDSGDHLGVVGKSYCPCQNEFVWRVLQEADFGKKGEVQSVRQLKHGGLINIDVKVVGLRCQTTHNTMNVHLRVVNSHDGTRNFEACPVIVMPKGGTIPAFTNAHGGLAGAWKVRHRSSIRNAVADMSKVWSQTVDIVKTSVPVLQQYTNRDLDGDSVRALLIASIDRSGMGTTREQAQVALERLEEAAFTDLASGTRLSLFEVVDRIAAYADHKVRVKRSSGRSVEEARALSSLNGSANRLKNCVLNELQTFLKR